MADKQKQQESSARPHICNTTKRCKGETGMVGPKDVNGKGFKTAAPSSNLKKS